MPRLVLVTVGQDVNSLFNDGDDDQDELKQGTANDDLLIESLPAAVTIREVKYCSCQRNGSSTEHECCEVLVGMSWCTTIVVAKCSGGSAETRLLGWGGKQCVNPTTISGAEIRAMSRSCSIVTCSWNHWYCSDGVCETSLVYLDESHLLFTCCNFNIIYQALSCILGSILLFFS